MLKELKKGLMFLFDKIGVYLALLSGWILVGGTINFLPYLGLNIERYVNQFSLDASHVIWLFFPVTSLIFVMKESIVTIRLVYLHVIIWLCFTIWVWLQIIFLLP